MWTEIIADSLRQAGHTVGVSYHNRKTLQDRLVLAGKTLLQGETRKTVWIERHRRQLLEAMSHEQWDVLLSIQGTVDQQTVRQCRQYSPGLKVFFWWGDIFTDQAQARISYWFPAKVPLTGSARSIRSNCGTSRSGLHTVFMQ